MVFEISRASQFKLTVRTTLRFAVSGIAVSNCFLIGFSMFLAAFAALLWQLLLLLLLCVCFVLCCVEFCFVIARLCVWCRDTQIACRLDDIAYTYGVHSPRHLLIATRASCEKRAQFVPLGLRSIACQLQPERDTSGLQN